ncbi:MAG TPA: RNA polymerase factor sigma-32 [Alphaproteobacteria bacterium]|nr:RNA polymerase factor sigma-32 [Alphaproteobacteria bacterium]
MSIANTKDTERSDRRYIAAAMDAPYLEREYEQNLGRRWRDSKDERALNELIESHTRLVVRIASRYRSSTIPRGDLVQEGNIGLMEAALRFDPERNVRFSTYATWWIVRMIRNYMMRNASIVRVATTPSQRRVYFNLWRLRSKAKVRPDGTMTDEDRARIAKELDVPLADVERIDLHFARPDQSLNLGIGEDDSLEIQDLIPDARPNPEATVASRHDRKVQIEWLHQAMDTLTDRERSIIKSRFLGDDKTTLSDIGEDFGVTKERIRQIERQALGKLRHALAARVQNGAELFDN